MKKITSEIIEDIKSRIDIVDLIGERVDLKKTGSNHKGLCPFHNEKTPSFSVSSEKQIYKCFGCGKAGDAISFLMDIETLDFHEAVEKLAKMAGVELLETNSVSTSKINYQASLQDINILARDFFIKNLRSNSTAKQYLKERSLDQELIDDFSLGFSEDSWDRLENYFVKKGVILSQAVSLGLLREKNGKYYDYFRNRIIFPIFNHKGQLLAFGGRILTDNKEAKYINSPENEIYTKGNVLYGLNITAQHIKEKGFVIVVEGYMDLLSLYQAGIKNVVASLGTSFTAKQSKLIKKYTNRVVMFYDGDEAGVVASMRSFNNLVAMGLSVDALFLEDKMDPDDAAKKYPLEKLEKMFSEAEPLMLKIINDKFSKIKTLSDKNLAISDIISLIALFKEDLDRLHWINELSFRTKIPFKELKVLCDKQRKEPSQPRNITRPLLEKIDKLYINFVKTIFFRSSFCIKIIDENLDQYLPDLLRDIVYEVKASMDDTLELKLEDWINISRKLSFKWLEELVCKESMVSARADKIDLEKNFSGCFTRFKISFLEKKRLDTFNKIKDGEEKTLREYSAIVKEIKNLSDLLGKTK